MEIYLSGTKQFENQLFAEIRGRIKEDDISAPLRKGPYYYYKKNLQGKEYVQHCRRLITDNKSEPSVYDTMQTGPDAPPEHVILDENIKAQEHDYYRIGAFKVGIDFYIPFQNLLFANLMFHFLNSVLRPAPIIN